MRRSAIGGVLISSAVLLSACGGAGSQTQDAGSGGNNAGGKAELVWWHNATDEPLKGYFQQAADAYTAKHPNVTFK
ncbi:MAG: ABC transporter substrate-binding protein, partial [Actinomycetota bacterium]|nr:ABC transporter substrate-binding protein [Actinomycetota bacterium]